MRGWWAGETRDKKSGKGLVEKEGGEAMEQSYKRRRTGRKGGVMRKKKKTKKII